MAAIVDAHAAARRVDSARIKPLPETTPTLIAMLRAPEGATIEEIMTATSWQSHTVRGAMVGALKKKLGPEVTSEKTEGRGRVYRLPSV